jgi:hypothetical protein
MDVAAVCLQGDYLTWPQELICYAGSIWLYQPHGVGRRHDDWWIECEDEDLTVCSQA